MGDVQKEFRQLRRDHRTVAMIVVLPDLAAWLPRLRGLVAETGSPLSHLAVLARELNVPTVVAVAGDLGEVARTDQPTPATTPTTDAA